MVAINLGDVRGATGDKGDKGDKGEKGDTGDTGATGATGSSQWVTSGNNISYSAGGVGIGAVPTVSPFLVDITNWAFAGYDPGVYLIDRAVNRPNARITMRTSGEGLTIRGDRSAAATSVDSPTALIGGERLFSLVGAGYNGAVWDVGGVISVEAAGAWSTTSQPTRVVIASAASGSTTRLQRLTVNGYGAIGLGGMSAKTAPAIDCLTDLIIPSATPASSSAAGEQGKLCMDGWYLYGWTGTNQCKRIAWTTF